MRSYRRERMKELRDGMHRRHAAAGRVVVGYVKSKTPVDAGILRASISSDSHEDHVDIGTNLKYAPYVHQGTYDYKHGYRGWGEAEAREAEAFFFHNSVGDNRPRGALPRPFLVNGLLEARPFLYAIYNKSIN